MKPQIQAIADDFARLRQHVRPEGDSAAGALAVSIEQAWLAAHELDGPVLVPVGDATDTTDARPSSTEPA